MDPRIIDLYNEELLHFESEARDFAKEFPESAARLSLNQAQVEDPYVERLLEGVAFLAARVRLKLEAQYPVFTQQLLEVLFPGWLSPSPSACVLKLAVDPASDKLPRGCPVPSRSLVRASLRGNAAVQCEFETCRDVTLWPLAIRHVGYIAAKPELVSSTFARPPLSSLRMEFELLGEADLETLGLDALPIFVSRSDVFGTQLMELLAGRCEGISVSADPSGRRAHAWLPASAVAQIGYGADEALFPMPVRGHAGFRVLKEYAALPEKFRFVEVFGLQAALRGLKGKRFFLTFYFSGVFPRLAAAVKADSLAIHCVPAVNLRQYPIGRVDVTAGQTEYLLDPNVGSLKREIIDIVDMRGGGRGVERKFRPVFEAIAGGKLASTSYYSVRRQQRMATQAEISGRPATYPGTDTFVSLSEPGAPPYGRDLQYLSIQALCSNRDLPLYLKAQFSDARYAFADDYPVDGVECVAGPSMPLAPAVDGFDPWIALSHLYVNYLSLFDDRTGEGADALRAMLGLYSTVKGHFLVRQAESLTGITARQITRRIPGGGPLAFGRGVEIELAMNDRAFDGGSPYLLASVLEHFLASHVSINSFVETRLNLVDRAERIQWPSRFGRRPSF